MSRYYPKSDNGIQCITQCYPKGTKIKHPLTGQEISDDTNPFCAIVPITKNNEIKLTDTCDPLITPKQDKLRTFLKYYNITSPNDFYIWLKNYKDIPVFTLMRVIDCFMLLFGKTITIIDKILSDCIEHIIKLFWIKKMYGKLCNYVSVFNDTCHFVPDKSNKLKKTDDIKIRTKFLLSELVTYSNIFEITNKYFNEFNNRSTFGMSDFLVFLISDLEKKIQKLIKL